MIKVVFFASLREDVGMAEQWVAATRMTEVFAQLRQTLSETAMTALTAENVRVAVNQALVEQLDAVELKEGDEVAFLPPVTGG
jgi:molybdopterin synthase sulfur carrier subunit